SVIRPAVPSAVLYEAGGPATDRPRALGQCIPRPRGRCTDREARAVPPAPRRIGARVGGKVSACESSTSVVKNDQAHGADGPVCSGYGGSILPRHGRPTLSAWLEET